MGNFLSMGLLCLLLMWCTTEVSQKVYLESLLFWLAFVAGLICAPGVKDDIRHEKKGGMSRERLL
jgi:hypothetical protein